MRPWKQKLKSAVGLLLLFQLSASPALAQGSSCADALQHLFPSAPASAAPLRAPIGSLKRLSTAADWGPRVELRLGTSGGRKPQDIQTLTIGQYNVLDFNSAKPDKDIRGVAETILRADPDILVLEEVSNARVLSEFNTIHLGGRYEPLLMEGNGSGIHVGFLLKKDLPFDVEAQSFKNVAEATSDAPLFSRDLPVLVFRETGGDARGPPRLAVAGTHYKSQRSRDATVDTAAVRTRQAEASAEILQHYRRELGPTVPLFLAGDFNDDVRHAASFDPLKTRLGFCDSFDLAPASKSVSASARTTQTFHPRDGSPTKHSQLDAILVSGVTSESGLIREAQVVPYRDAQGNVKPVPQTIQQRYENPSDHFMIRTVIDYAKLRTQ
jgi:hypothetical protein